MSSKKWFTARTIPELKKEYRELAKKNHPDMGGNESDMMEINSQFDELVKILPNVNAQGGEYHSQKQEIGKEFRDAIMTIIHCMGIEIEICGSWIWVTGNTIIHKEILKKAGYQFSSKKIAWYWHNEGYRKTTNKSYTLNDIRTFWGSEKIETEKQPIIA